MPGVRIFRLVRDVDSSGISGVGHVADGVVFPDGATVMRWRGDRATTVIHPDIENVIELHGHNGSSYVEWVN